MTLWSPVVYGRTHRVDRWWRAWPEQEPPQGWAGRALSDVVNGGKLLVRWDGARETETPRYLLARGASGVLVGVACRAKVLSGDMHTDLQGGRELYCFVGWFGRDPGTTDLPSLAELSGQGIEWASRQYERFMGPVWQAHEGQFDVERTVPEEAPWKLSSHDRGQALLPLSTDTLHYFPADGAEDLWKRAVVTRGEFALATGWQEAPHRPPEHLTHLCLADLTAPKELPKPRPKPAPAAPRPPSPAQAAAGGPARRQPPPWSDRPEPEEPSWGMGKILRRAVSPRSHEDPYGELPRPFGGDTERARQRAAFVEGLPRGERQRVKDAQRDYKELMRKADEAQRKADHYRAKAAEAERRVAEVFARYGFQEAPPPRTETRFPPPRPGRPLEVKLPERSRPADGSGYFGEFDDESGEG